jgi:hypothetical protein
MLRLAMLRASHRAAACSYFHVDAAGRLDGRYPPPLPERTGFAPDASDRAALHQHAVGVVNIRFQFASGDQLVNPGFRAAKSPGCSFRIEDLHGSHEKPQMPRICRRFKTR